jgi:carbohydrate diacid regulator
MLSRELAQEIVQETMSRLNRNINIMDNNGCIIASGDAAREGTYHEAAAEVIRTGKTLVITTANQAQWQGVSRGVNLPIIFQNRTVGVVGITGEPAEILPYGELVKMTTEMMLTQNYLMLQKEWRQMAMDVAIGELIRMEKQDLQLAKDRLEALKISMQPPYQLAVISLQSRTLQTQSLLLMAESVMGGSRLVSSFLNVHTWAIVFYGKQEDQVQSSMERLHVLFRKKGIEAVSGLSSSVRSLEYISYAYHEACTALALGGKQGRSLTNYLAVETQALLSEVPEETKSRFMERLLPKLTDKLLETLQVFLACNLHIAMASEQLKVHRNTLVYRLSQIREATGYDPQLFKDAITLQVLIWLKEEGAPAPK